MHGIGVTSAAALLLAAFLFKLGKSIWKAAKCSVTMKGFGKILLKL